MDRQQLEDLVRSIVLETGDGPDQCPVRRVRVEGMALTEADRLDTGSPQDLVFTRDLFTLDESPRLGAGLMEMERSTFPWTLTYDEIDYVLDGRLSILIGGKTISAGPGEAVLIPKNTAISFSAQEKTRFLYFVYPANWQGAT